MPRDDASAPRREVSAADGGVVAQVRERRAVWLAAIAAMVAFLAVYGLWSRLSDSDGEGPAAPAELLPATTAAGTSLAAVGRTSGLAEPCTAWLLEIDAPAAEPARALTAGRCVGAGDPGVVLTEVATPEASVTFQVFAPQTGSVTPEAVEVPIEAAEWGAVRGTDLALLRLGTSYAELAANDVRPIPAAEAAPVGTQILVAGVPVGGPAAGEPYLRGSRCQVGPSSEVLQGPWLWRDMQAVACTGVLGGSRGSVVLTESGDAVGMVITTTIGAPDGGDCTVRRPCEVSPDGGVRVHGNTSYVAPLTGIPTCFVDGELSLGAPCPLEPPEAAVAARAASAAARPGQVIRVRVPGAAPGQGIRVKQGPLGPTDCLARQQWLPGIPAAARGRAGARTRGSATWVHDVTLPDQEARLVVCVGSADHPTSIVLAADATAPDPGWITLDQTPVTGGVRVEPVLDPPELVRFRWVSGPAPAIQCDEAEGYVEYPGNPATIQAADLPSIVCVRAIDAAGNRSQPATFTVE